MTRRASSIGLGQARRLCQMPQRERLAFIGEGLPIVLASAQGFWQAAKELDGHVREAVVLARHAEEEAAKVLILVDMVRCPAHLVASRIGTMVKWFYNHLARLIYAEAVSRKPMHVAQLQEYVDLSRRSHHVDGAVGEYIVPNSAIYNREGVLYSDIAEYEGEGATWHGPSDLIHEFSFPRWPPRALALAEAMSHLGMFSRRGLELVATVWGTVEFKEQETVSEARALTRTLVERLVDEELSSEHAEQEHAQSLFEEWPLPMYHLDLAMIEVPFDELKREQDNLLWDEIGGY